MADAAETIRAMSPAARLEFVAWLLDPRDADTGEQIAPFITREQAKSLLETDDG